MVFMWDSNIVVLIKEQSWHLEFSDFENMGNFELKLFVMDTAEHEYIIAEEDGSKFKQYELHKYPYFLFDYCAEVVNEIGREIKAGREVIDIETILNQVKSKWGVEN